MKILLYGFLMCQSMFCSFPCPWNVWDEKARDTMLLWLPVVGAEIGAVWYALFWICNYLEFGAWITGLVLAAFPFLATGYIHLDGFMDVTDAVKSCRSLERRREILKDSHVGSFAVIGCVLLILSQFALCASFPNNVDGRILFFIPAVSRCCSILAVLLLPKMAGSQYEKTVKDKKAWCPGLMLAVLICIAVCFLRKYGIVLIAECAAYGLALRKAYRSLDGMNGDVSGYALTVSELAAIAATALI